MTLFEEIVNECELLNELSTNRDDDIKKAINNVLRVRITYDDGKDRVISRAKGKRERYILPVAYGVTKRGNRAIRAYQTAGSTKRGVPKWKLFLLKNIHNWSNGTRSFKKYGETLINLGLNTSGDKGLTTLFAVTPIGHGNVSVANDSNPITPEPIAKTDVQPTNAVQKPEASTDNEKFVPSQSKTNTSLDNSRQKTYFQNRIESPATQPVNKTEVQPQTTNDVGGTNDNNMSQPQVNSTPIKKSDIMNTDNQEQTPSQTDNASNELSRRYNDLLHRMDNLYNDEEEDNEE